MKIKFGLLFLILFIIALLVMGFAVIMQQRAYGRSLELRVTAPEFLDIEDGLYFDTAFDKNTGFAVNPYQTDNSEQRLAVIITASVSHILKEVRAFMMFTVLLLVLALTAYLIIVCIVLNKDAKPAAKPAENEKNSSGGENKMTLTIRKRVNDGNVSNIRNFSDAVISQNSSVTESTSSMGLINEKDSLNKYIEEQTTRMAVLSLKINEMLSDISAVLERSKVTRQFS